MSFGKTLREFRILRHFSQSTLAKKTKIPQTTLSDFENDKYLPNIKQAFIITKELGVTVAQFLEEEEQSA